MVVDANASVRILAGSFTRIKISNAFKVIITQSETESIAISAAEEKYKEEIKTEIENGTLKIYYGGGTNWKGRDRKLKAYVSFKNLSHLEVLGASDVAVVGKITTTGITINVSGASTFKGDVSADNLEIKMSGASKGSFSGNSEMLNVDCSGATDLNAYNLKAVRCNAEVSGASNIDIFVSGELNATASGASRIRYKGNPQVSNVKKSGVSTISKED
jgi:hypothetical protein